MLVFISVSLSLILITLSLLHFYWVAGGTVALDGAIPPTMRQGFSEPGPKPGFRILTFIVGLCLALAAGVALSYLIGGIPASVLPYRPWFSIALSGLFLLRTVGDFNEVGLFARRGDDIFFVRDRAIYSPLCFVMAALWGGLYWIGG